MSKRNDGGAAFPHAIEESWGGERSQTPVYGMTLRDWFAGQAFASALFEADSYEQAASRAYEMADAMLKARES